MTRPGKNGRDGTSATFHHDSNIVNVHTTTIPAEFANIGSPTRNGGYTINGFDGWMIENGYRVETEAMSAIRQQMPASAPFLVTGSGAETVQGASLMQQGALDPETTRPGARIVDMLLDTDQLDQITPPEPLVDGWLFRDSLAWMFGPSGQGKSFVAVDLAMHVGTGQDWHGHSVNEGTVLYMAAEGVAGMQSRTSAWYEANGKRPTDVYWLPEAVNMYEPMSSLEMIDACRIMQPDLIIIDTLARASVGAEENSATAAGILIDNMDQLRTAAGGACVLMVHHTGKDAGQGGRGSSAFKGAMESEIEVQGSEFPRLLTVKNTKQKNIEQSRPLQFFGEHQLISGSLALRLSNAEPERSEGEVLDLDMYACLSDIYDGINPVTSSQWRRSCEATLGMAESTFHRRKKVLFEAHPDWVDLTTKKGYFIPLI